MKKNLTRLALGLLLLSVLVPIGAAFAGDVPEPTIKMLKYDVSYTNLGLTVHKPDASGKVVPRTSAYVVRVFGTFPTGTALAMTLFVGDAQVEEYGDFPGGIYFYVYDKDNLSKMSGKAFNYKWGNGVVKPLGFSFNAASFDLSKTVDREKVLSGR